MSAAKKQEFEQDPNAQPVRKSPPTPLELITKHTGVDIKKKLGGGNGPLSKKLAGIGFAAGAYLSFGPLAPYLEKIPFDKIPFANMVPVPGGPKVLVVGAIVAGIAYLVGEVLDPQPPK